MDETILLALAALAGGAFGFFADRLAVRWPEHEEGVAPRRLDWRTAVLALAGAGISAGLLLRWDDPRDLLVLYIYCAALLVLLATDLDQRLLPDLITYPLIVFTGAVLLLGWAPPLAGQPLGLLSGIAAGVGLPLFLLVTDFLLRGSLGLGDVKLGISLGFMSGAAKLFSALVVSTFWIAALLLVLMALRRIGRKTLIPFGPMLISAGFLAVLLR